MPNNTGIPVRKSVDFFEKVISSHSAVKSLVKISKNVYRVERARFDPIVVFLTDLYTVGIADAVDAKSKIQGLNCIVTISNWNGYSRAAKTYGNENAMGIFLLSEFMGSLHKEDFWKYFQKNDKGEPIYYYNG